MKHFILLTSVCLLFGFYARSQSGLNMNVPQQSKCDTVTASFLAGTRLDSNIVSFSVSAKSGDTWIEVNVQGNELSEKAKELILGLKPGQKVLYEQVNATRDGKIVKIPGKVFVIGKEG